MRLVLALLAVGCGRIGFSSVGAGDAPGGDAVTGHDEDGDGVPDLVDVCPHLAGPQLDSDGDGVGDACDPEPANPRQHRLLFAAMTPDDQPFEINSGGAQSQLPDAVGIDGQVGTQLLDTAVTYSNVQITVGTVVHQVLGAGVQHQLAIQPTANDATPYTFVELNELSMNSVASITAFDGTTYSSLANAQLVTGFHAGDLQLQLTGVVGGAVTLDGGWPGEPYHLAWPGPWGGGTACGIVVNNLTIDVDYVFVVSW